MDEVKVKLATVEIKLSIVFHSRPTALLLLLLSLLLLLLLMMMMRRYGLCSLFIR